MRVDLPSSTEPQVTSRRRDDVLGEEFTTESRRARRDTEKKENVLKGLSDSFHLCMCFLRGSLCSPCLRGESFLEIPLAFFVFHGAFAVFVDGAGVAFGFAGGGDFGDDVVDGRRVGFDAAGAQLAADGAVADAAFFDDFAGGGFDEVVGLDPHAAAADDGAFAGEVEVDEFDVFELDVLPDVEFGPVGEGEDAEAFAGVVAGVEESPEFGALVFGVPDLVAVAEGEDAFFGAGTLFVAAGTAEGGVEAVELEGLDEGAGFEVFGALGAGPVFDVAAELFEGFFVFVDDEFGTEFFGEAVAVGVHLGELEGGVDVHQGEGELAGAEGFAGDVEHAGGVFADGEEHDGLFAFGDDFAHDVDGFVFEAFEVGG